jgi:hypothetical protein
MIKCGNNNVKMRKLSKNSIDKIRGIRYNKNAPREEHFYSQV